MDTWLFELFSYQPMFYVIKSISFIKDVYHFSLPRALKKPSYLFYGGNGVVVDDQFYSEGIVGGIVISDFSI